MCTNTRDYSKLLSSSYSELGCETINASATCNWYPLLNPAINANGVGHSKYNNNISMCSRVSRQFILVCLFVLFDIFPIDAAEAEYTAHNLIFL